MILSVFYILLLILLVTYCDIKIDSIKDVHTHYTAFYAVMGGIAIGILMVAVVDNLIENIIKVAHQ